MGHTPKYLGHVNVNVRNAERSRKWYEEVLGLHTYDFVPGRAAFMAANREESHEIALTEVGEKAAGLQSGQVGLGHMAWKMGSLDDLKELHQRLLDLGIDITPADHGVSLGIYFKDPDGNGIEVYYEQPRSEWYREDRLFIADDRPSGQFPGPWDEQIAARQQASR